MLWRRWIRSSAPSELPDGPKDEITLPELEALKEIKSRKHK
jgi:hypothetical protein